MPPPMIAAPMLRNSRPFRCSAVSAAAGAAGAAPVGFDWGDAGEPRQRRARTGTIAGRGKRKDIGAPRGRRQKARGRDLPPAPAAAGSPRRAGPSARSLRICLGLPGPAQGLSRRRSAPMAKVTHKGNPLDIAGTCKVLDIVVSLDTGICAASARKFNETAGTLPNTVVLVISGDLPFAAG